MLLRVLWILPRSVHRAVEFLTGRIVVRVIEHLIIGNDYTEDTTRFEWVDGEAYRQGRVHELV